MKKTIIALTLAVVILTGVLCSCSGGGSNIVGEWKMIDGNYTLKFNSNGKVETGSLYGGDYEYKIKGNKIQLICDNEVDAELIYSIKDGILTVIEPLGEGELEIKFERVK